MEINPGAQFYLSRPGGRGKLRRGRSRLGEARAITPAKSRGNARVSRDYPCKVQGECVQRRRAAWWSLSRLPLLRAGGKHESRAITPAKSGGNACSKKVPPGGVSRDYPCGRAGGWRGSHAITPAKSRGKACGEKKLPEGASRDLTCEERGNCAWLVRLTLLRTG